MSDEEYYEEDDNNYGGYDPYQNDVPEDVVKTATFQQNIYYSSEELFDHIKQKCRKEILTVFSNLSFDQVIMLLLAYKFNFEKLYAHLGDDAELVLVKNNIRYQKHVKEIDCQICLEKFKGSFYTCCGYICDGCMVQHARTSITDWKLDISCPACDAKLYPSTLSSTLFVEFRKRFVILFMRSEPNYVQCLDCQKYIEYWRTKKIIECECHCQICHQCGGFAHQPLDCNTYKKWNEKIVDQSRNILWILKNSKKCGRCGWFIEKNSGCNHMTCRKCNYQFCWLCLGDWTKHRNCTAFDEKGAPVENKMKMSSQDAKKLQFYGIRYENFEEGEKFAKKTKQQLPNKIQTFSFLLDVRPSQFDFFYDALNTMIMTRRRVKCLYAYIFMAKLNEHQKSILQCNLQTVQTNLQQLTFRIEGVLNSLNQNQMLLTIEDIMQTKKKIIEYKSGIYKFMELVLADTEKKK